MTGRRPTIREVAARAGVSIGTVSHVLTGRRVVRAGTRAAIDAAILELGYVPDAAARALIARRGRLATPHDPLVPRLTCVGYLCADHTAQVAILPHRDDRMKAIGIEKTLGGCAANVAVTAAGLGRPLPVAAELLTVVGDDSDSDWALSVLARRHVALHPLSRQPGARLSRCFILVEGHGSRTIINEPLQVPADTLRRWLGSLPRAHGVHCLHLQGDQLLPLADLMPEARARGLKPVVQATALDTEWRNTAGLSRLRDLFDLVVLNREVARDIVGPSFRGSAAELVRRMDEAARGPGAALLLTLGPEGAVLFEAGAAPLHVAAPTVEPVDTTGAGDTFTGAFLAAWLNGVDHRAALRLAVDAGARSVTLLGAQEHGLAATDLLDAPHDIP